MSIPSIGSITMPSPPSLSPTGNDGGDPWGEFSAMLTDQIKETDRLEKRSKDLGQRALLGNSGVSIHEAQIAASEAELHLRLMLQVRNKALDVYREIMSMPA